jgi:hypothetical protein
LAIIACIHLDSVSPLFKLLTSWCPIILEISFA